LEKFTEIILMSDHYYLSRTHSFSASLAPFLEGLPIWITVRQSVPVRCINVDGESVTYRGRYVSPAYDH